MRIRKLICALLLSALLTEAGAPAILADEAIATAQTAAPGIAIEAESGDDEPGDIDRDTEVCDADDFADTGLTAEGAEPEDDAPEEALIFPEAAPPMPEEPEEQVLYPVLNLSPEAAINGYINQTLKAAGEGSASLRAAYATAGARLTGTDARLYSALKARITQVAAGELSDTKFNFATCDILDDASFTAAELGLDTLYDDSGVSAQAIAAFRAAVTPNISRVIGALLADCPYELYWYDKTGTGGIRWSLVPWTAEGETIRIRNYSTGIFYLKFAVAAEYAATGKPGTYATDPSKGASVQAAAANARAIVESNASGSDLGKLNAYRAEICQLAGYNYDAAAGKVDYGNPWQLVWVFDGDPETKVVCEGYAKAFQYLCDMSAFTGSVSVTSVTGTLSDIKGSVGKHMWNIVALGGVNYLADLTNCDTGTPGYPDKLFLKGYSRVTTDGDLTYAFELPGNTLSYTFDTTTIQLYRDEDLDLSDDPVGPDERTDVSGSLGGLSWRLNSAGVLFISGSGPIPDFTVDPAPWDASAVRRVNLVSGITAVGAGAFRGCANLAQVSVPASVGRIADDAFEGCALLVGEGATGVVTVSCAAEEACRWARAHVANCRLKHGKAVADAAVEATCTESGLSAGSHCQTCGAALIPQTIVPAKGHRPTAIRGHAATCTASGLTDGNRCSVCDAVLAEQQVIPAKGHRPKVVRGRAATCTATGLTDGSRCSVCDAVLAEQEVIPARGHRPEVVRGRAATYVQEGLSDGKRCAVCGVWTQPQRTLPRLVYPGSVLTKRGWNGTITVNVGERFYLTPAFATSANLRVKRYKTSRKRIVRVNNSGLVVAKKAGVATITVVTQNKRKKATVRIKVVDPYKPRRVRIRQGKTVTLRIGQTLQLEAFMQPSTARSALKWKSNRRHVATVSSGGLVKAKRKGKAKITVTTKNKKKATITIKVIP